MNRSLVDLLRDRASAQPDRLAFTFCGDASASAVAITYGDLDRRARAIAARLQAHGVTPEDGGNTAVLLYASARPFLEAFLGCLYAGVIAVPVAWRSLRRGLESSAHVLADSEARVALLHEEPPAEHWSAAPAGLAAIATGAIEASAADDWRPPDVHADALAYLQYTSGSTSLPRGVMVRHAHVMANLRDIDRGFTHDTDSVIVSWLPHFHDMGLLYGLLQPIFNGVPAVVLPPAVFIQRPARWLEAISTWRGTHSGGPNFAYDLCVRKVRDEDLAAIDLRTWRIAFNGAEPVRAATLQAFANRFAACGFRAAAFRPAYGLAEATLKVTSGDGGCGHGDVGGRGGRGDRERPWRTFDRAALELRRAVEVADTDPSAWPLVSCGAPEPDTNVHIVDPVSLRACGEGEVGEIWVTGPGVTSGYWKQPAATAELFEARIADAHDDSARGAAHLRTGDLGFLHDGRLYVTGRLKELIIIRGRNYAPADLERTVALADDALHGCRMAAFSLDDARQERLTLVIEHAAGAGTGAGEDLMLLVAAVRRALAERHEVQAHRIVFCSKGGIPVSTSGKVQRYLCRQRLISGALPIVAESTIDQIDQLDQVDAIDDALVADDADDTARSVGKTSTSEDGRRQATLEFLIDRVARLAGVDRKMIDVQAPPTAAGLDSLGALELTTAIDSFCGVSVAWTDLVGDRSLADLARTIAAEAAQAPRVAQEQRAPQPHGDESAGRAGTPVSPEQERFWWLHQLSPGSPVHNVTCSIRIRGPLDVARLRRALARVMAEHDALRTSFHEEQGAPVHVIHHAASLQTPLRIVAQDANLEDMSGPDGLVAKQHAEPFDLRVAPLLHCTLVTSSLDDHRLIVTMPHIVTDGLSLLLFARGLRDAYERNRDDDRDGDGNGDAGGRSTVADVRSLRARRVRDFAARAPRRVDEEQPFERERAHWRRQLAGVEPLWSSSPQAGALHRTHTRSECRLDADLVASLRALARRERATLNSVLLAAFQLVLAERTGRHDLLIACPAHGRDEPESSTVIGLFATPVLIRAHLGAGAPFRAVVAEAHRTMVEALAHARLPFAALVDAARVRADGKRPHNLLQASFTLIQEPREPAALGDVRFEPPRLEALPADLELSLTLAERDGEIDGWMSGREDLFPQQAVRDYTERLLAVLRHGVSMPSMPEAPAPAFAPPLTAEQRLRIVIAATFTAEPLRDSLQFWMDHLHQPADLQFTTTGQVFQALLDPASALQTNAMGINAICLRPQDLGNDAHRAASSARELGELVRRTSAAGGTYLVCVCAPAAGDADSDSARTDAVEAALADTLANAPGTMLIRSGDIHRRYPVAACVDAYADRLGNVPFTPAFYTAIGTSLARAVRACTTPPHKVIVLDCDQTLWKGVCGEDGPDAVSIDAPRRHLQQFVLDRRAAGMLLCLCSKNDERDVAAVFERGPRMPLTREHISASRINWQPKPENLAALSAELGLPLSSFVVIDDDPVECATIRAQCPDVLTVQWPAAATEVPALLDHVWALDLRPPTLDGANRPAYYRDHAARERLRGAARDLDEFLDRLELTVDIVPLGQAQIDRVAELTQRTTQFNVTGRRWSAAQMRHAEGLRVDGLVCSARDKFGDYGQVGAILFTAAPDALIVDTFVLSCRALGRRIEHRMLGALGRLACARGLAQIRVSCTATSRNEPARTFLELVADACRVGGVDDDGVRTYEMPSIAAAAVWPEPANAETPRVTPPGLAQAASR